jgi:hypothetical protein
MFKIIIILLLFTGSAGAADIINETNIFDENFIIGGSDYIVPHSHYWDSWFSLHNNGNINYNIYMYNYTGIHPDKYTDSFIGVIKPTETITLNSNAFYRIYGDYNSITDITPEKIEKNININWFTYLLIIIGVIVGVKIIRVVLWK